MVICMSEAQCDSAIYLTCSIPSHKVVKVCLPNWNNFFHLCNSQTSDWQVSKFDRVVLKRWWWIHSVDSFLANTHCFKLGWSVKLGPLIETRKMPKRYDLSCDILSLYVYFEIDSYCLLAATGALVAMMRHCRPSKATFLKFMVSPCHNSPDQYYLENVHRGSYTTACDTAHCSATIAQHNAQTLHNKSFV